jgi:hypothetical protein
MSDFSTYIEVVARKEHKCAYCSKPIAKGEAHDKWSGVYDGAFCSNRAHFACLDNKYLDECSLDDQIDCLAERLKDTGGRHE